MLVRLLMAIGLLTLSLVTQARWQLDSDASNLSFISIKNGTIVETHTFSTLSGEVGNDGNAAVIIALSSVQTLIPIRDERMN